MRIGRIVLAALGLALAAPAAAQTQPASLIADRVAYDPGSGVLEASGSVEVLYQGQVLRADRIRYETRSDLITASGPLVLTDAAGNVLLADEAALTPDLREGLIAGARVLIAGELQVAAAEVRRRGGRYTTLSSTVASTCTICAGSTTPTWALRAARVTQDAVARRIYFENATFELFGVPVGFLPRLSIPDPSVDRASGVLVPMVLSSDIFGFGLKVPYYRVLSPQADATLTPFLTSRGGALLEAEYRQRFRRGGIEIWGALTLVDGLEEASRRGALIALGDFTLGRGFGAQFDINLTSDDDFLEQFDYGDEDRLTSLAQVTRTLAREHLELSVIGFQSLRTGEQTANIPFILPDFRYRRLFEPPVAGGVLALDLQSLGVLRDEGRKVLRWGGGLDWRRDVLLPGGVLTAALAEAQLDAYRIWDDPDIPDAVQGRGVPEAGIELRWPFLRRGTGATHVIEPIAQVFYSRTLGDDAIPNEDSQLPELDRSNLFSGDRFPGRDRVETGLRANLGVSYTLRDADGWVLSTTFGQVVRDTRVDDFSEGTGLAGRWSDYVGTVALEFLPSFRLVNRALFAPENGIRRNEFAFAYEGDRGAARATYVYLVPDLGNPILGPQPETNDVSLDARYRLLRNWEIRANWRFDAATGRTLRAGGGIAYGNDCAIFDLSASRRNTSSSNVPPATTVGFSVRLAGLGGTDERKWPARPCARLSR